MNEEEKKAIEDTKDILKELNKHKDKDFIGRLYYKNKPIEDILQILLNLIDKQQKEIEELKGINAIQKYRIEVIDERELISKDKIKKLKELVHKTLDDNGITRGYQLTIDNYFKVLLGE